jgi:hypothetical protein
LRAFEVSTKVSGGTEETPEEEAVTMIKLPDTHTAEVAPMRSPQGTPARAIVLAGLGTGNVFARRLAR